MKAFDRKGDPELVAALQAQLRRIDRMLATPLGQECLRRAGERRAQAEAEYRAGRRVVRGKAPNTCSSSPPRNTAA